MERRGEGGERGEMERKKERGGKEREENGEFSGSSAKGYSSPIVVLRLLCFLAWLLPLNTHTHTLFLVLYTSHGKLTCLESFPHIINLR